jgi:PAS domain S-box-containing protein
MDTDAHAPLHATLVARRSTIADHWYRAVARTGFAPLDGPEVRARLLALTDRAIAALLAEPFAPDEARQIGAALAELHYLHPVALAGTLTVLGAELVADVPPAAAATLQPSLAALLGALAGGYYAAARAAILAEQEAARAPLLAEQRRIEAILRAGEARYRAVVEQAAEGIFLFEAASKRIVEANPAFCRLLGYGAEEIAALTLYDLIAHDRASVEANTRRIVAEGQHAIGERDYRRKDDSTVLVEVSATALHDDDALVCVVVRDSTARRAAAESLRASEAKLQAVVRNAPVLLFTLDAAGVTTFAAGQGLAALEHTLEGVVGRSPSADAPRNSALPGYVRRALAGEAVEARVAAGERIFATHYAPLRAASGAIVGVTGVATDITAWARAEAERDEARLQLAARLEEERLRLARELHDGPVQDLLAVRYQLLTRPDRPAPPAIRERLLDVIGQLRGIIGELRPAGLDDFGLLTALEEYAAQLRRDLEPGGPTILLNLDPGGQTLPSTVATCLFHVAQEALRNALTHARADQIRLTLGLDSGTVTVRVADDGTGFVVPPRLAALARRQHFGLIGLAERVEWAGGQLTIASAPGAGTIVTIQLPCWSEGVDDETTDPGSAGR